MITLTKAPRRQNLISQAALEQYSTEQLESLAFFSSRRDEIIYNPFAALVYAGEAKRRREVNARFGR